MKVTIIALLMALSTSSFSQTKETYTILKCKDVMTEKEYAYGNENLVCISSDRKKGFRISIMFDFKKNDVVYKGFSVLSSNLGSCVEHDQIIILFEDGTKYESTSWNSFNCEGDSYFDYTSKDLDKLTKSKIKAIRFTNGRTYESMTYPVSESESNYFINVKYALENKVFGEGKCN